MNLSSRTEKPEKRLFTPTKPLKPAIAARFYFVLALWGFVLPPLVQAQSVILENYIQTGIASNLALKQQDIDLQKNLAAIQQAKGLFLPTVQFAATYTRAVGGRKIDFPIGDLLNPVYSTLNQITQTQAFPTLENQAIQLLPDNFHQTGVKFAYPIYNVDLKLNRAVQQQSLQTKNEQKAAFAHQLRYQITDAYLQYLQAIEAEKIWINAKTVLQELLRFNQSLVKNNVATKDIVATAEYEITKADNEIYQLQSAQKNASAYVNFLINRNLQEPVLVDSMLLTSALPNYDREQLIQQAMTNRREFAALRSGINTLGTVVKYGELSAKRPDAYIGGELGWQGFGYKFDKNQAYVLVQAGLTFDIFDGHQTKYKTQQNRLEKEKLETQLTVAQHQVEMQVTKAWNDYDAARNTWQAAQSGVRAAEAVFKIVNNKYRAQQALLLEFLDAQNRVATAQLKVVLALAAVLEKEAALQNAAGF